MDEPFERLFLDHAGAVRKLARLLTRNESEAEDVVAETFLRAISSPVRIEARTARAYLFTIARNLIQDRRRVSRRLTGLHDTHAPPSPYRADMTANLAELWDHIDQLPEMYRLPLLLSACENWSYQEIADSMGVPLSTIKIRLHRARLMLSESIEAHEQETEKR